ncbi:hypothetical protein FRB94_002621 [Tulasnella sp. JGI-2019a]|nr:hypothetical protein FRB94_002621 [Tulasnella sp. JGI-2019a]
MARILSILSAFAVLSAEVYSAPAPHPKYWFAFGDSYTTTGFNITTGPLPNLSNPFGNPAYPGIGPCADNLTNWIDDLTTVYNKSLIFTYNFAYNGAVIDESLVTPYLPTVLTIKDQVDQYLATVASRPESTPWTPENSIFSFFIGINDIKHTWNASGSRTAFDDVLLDDYFGLVEKVYDTGARNFLFFDVPPVNVSPLMLAEPVASQTTQGVIIDGFNARLAARVAQFDLSEKGVKALFYNGNTRVKQILKDPKKYGFVDNSTFGIDSSQYCWCNNYHLSPGVHSYFAQDITELFDLTFTSF